MAFDIESAKKAGYTDEEIARHLAKKRGYDYDRAIQSGYNPSEIFQYLSARPALATGPPTVLPTGQRPATRGTLPSRETLQSLSELGGMTGGAIGGAKAGALLGTAIAPGPGTAVGGLLGGLTGGTAGYVIPRTISRRTGVLPVKEGTPLLDLLTSEGGERVLEKLPLEVRDALEGLVMEVTGRGIGKGIGFGVRRVTAPFGKSVDIPVKEAAERYGIELPASAISKARAVPALEAYATKGLFGQRLADLVDRAGVKLNQIADETVGQFGKSTTGVEVGKSVEKGFGRFEETFRATKNSLYEGVSREGIPVDLTRTQSLLDGVIGDLENIAGQKPSILKYLKSLKQGLTPPEGKIIDAKKVHDTLKDINTKINFRNPNPIVQGYEGRLQGIGKSLSEDLDDAIIESSPELAEQIGKANSFYREGIERLNSKWGKSINDFINKGKSSEIPSMLLNRATPIDWIPKIYQTLGNGATKSLQAKTLENIVIKARGAENILKPEGFANAIKSYDVERLRAIFPAEVVDKLQDLSMLARSLGKGRRITEGSQTFFLQRLTGELTFLGYSLFPGGPSPLIPLSLIASDFMFSKFLTSPMGQKWLTTGMKDLTPFIQFLSRTSVYGIERASKTDLKE